MLEVRHEKYPELEGKCGTFRYGQCNNPRGEICAYNQFNFHGEDGLELLLVTSSPITGSEVETISRRYLSPLTITVLQIIRTDRVTVGGRGISVLTSTETVSLLRYKVTPYTSNGFEYNFRIEKEQVAQQKEVPQPVQRMEDIGARVPEIPPQPVNVEEVQQLHYFGPTPVELSDDWPEFETRRHKKKHQKYHYRRRQRSPSPESATIQP